MEKLSIYGQPGDIDPNGKFLGRHDYNALANKLNEIIDWINQQERNR